MAQQKGTPFRVFISHTYADTEFCRRFVAVLRGAGCDVWYDEHNLGVGGELRRAIEQSIASSDVFIVILSPAALASDWVTAESSAAFATLGHGPLQQVLPVVAVPCQIPANLQNVRRIDGNGQPLDPQMAAIQAMQAMHTPDPAFSVIAGPSSRELAGWRRGALAVVGGLAVLVVLCCIVVYLAGRNQQRVLGMGGTTPTISFPPAGENAQFFSDTDGWIVDNGYILHLQQGKWSVAANFDGDQITAISMLSDTSGWAVGKRGLLLHDVQGVWQQVTSPVGTDDLEGIDMLNANEGWAVGDINVQQPTGNLVSLLHYHDGTWQVVTPYFAQPYFSELYQVSFSDANTGWAVGGVLGSFVLRYHNGTWTAALPEDLTDVELHQLAVVAPNDIWACGGPSFGDGRMGMVHFNGTTWQHTGPTDSGLLQGVAMVSATEGWAVGTDTSSGQQSPSTGALYHYARGKWSRVILAGDTKPLYAIQMLSPTEGWIEGAQGMWHLSAGQWHLLNVTITIAGT